jgi:hypothetical protein
MPFFISEKRFLSGASGGNVGLHFSLGQKPSEKRGEHFVTDVQKN